MKTYFWMLMCLTLSLFSCGKSKEEQVRDFAVDFAEKASKNQIDSLKTVYTDIENADSVALKYIAEGIVIHPSEDGKEIEILLSPDVKIFVEEDGADNFIVTESYGLFAYSEETKKLANTLGLWKTDCSDVEQAKVLKEGIAEYESERAEAELFAKMMPRVEKILFGGNTYNYLKGLGFEGQKIKLDPYDGNSELNFYEKGTYSLKKGTRLCRIEVKHGEYGDEVQITIDGDEETLAKVYNDAKKLDGPNGDAGGEINVRKKGNKIIIIGSNGG